MKNFVLVGLCFGVIIFSKSCIVDSKDKRDFVELKKSNAERTIFSILIEEGDTIYNGTAKSYYSNGVLSRKESYVRNQREGLQTYFDTSGRLRSEIMYKYDLPNGKGVFYDTNGRKEKENVYVNGRLFFTTGFYADGKVRLYSALNDSLPFYIINFDSVGRKESERGYVFGLSEECFSGGLDSLYPGDPIEAIIPIAAIPCYSIRMKSAIFDSSGTTIAADSLRVFHDLALLNVKVENPGAYELGIAGELFNERGEVIRRDTLGVRLNILDRNN